MAQQIADRRDVDFVLHEQFRAAQLSGYDLPMSEIRDFRQVHAKTAGRA